VKIVLTTSIFPPDIGGPAHYVPQMAKELSQRGHQVAVVCLSELLQHDDRTYPFPVHRIPRRLFSPLRLLVATFKIYQQARQADLIYQNGLPVESALAAQLARVPVVAKVVSDYAWERARTRGWFKDGIVEYQVAKKGFGLQLLDWFRTMPLHHASRIIVPSVWLQQMVANWGIAIDSVQVVYNAIDSVKVAPKPEIDSLTDKVLITVCRLISWKGVDKIIQLLPDLQGVRLVVIGEGIMRSELEELGEKLGVSDRILFTGHLPQKDVFIYLQKADVFILNSAYEGLPHVVLEAMAAKVPVIATDAGGTGELVEHGKTGLLISVGDDQALQNAIQTLLKDSTLAKQLVKGAEQQLQSKFSYATMVNLTERILLSQGRVSVGRHC
jgi:glycosyltransferase involved in cell wall biosynthesis